MGMGGAFAGVDDLNSSLYNPAGLAWAKGVALSVRNMDNVSAMQAFPLGRGSSVGLAVITSKLSNIPITGGTAFSTSNVVYLTYGTKLTFLPILYNNPLFQRMSVGLNVKGLMGQTLQRTGELDNSAAGWNMDAGVLWKGTEWWTTGLSLQNFVPSGTMGTGGVIKWNIGAAEEVSQNIRIAGTAKIIGDVDSPVYMEDRELLLSGELNYSNQPTLLRFGGEWRFNRNYFVRTGLMQQRGTSGTATDINFGLGYRKGEWGIDFASYREPVRDERSLLLSILYFPKDWIVIKKLEVKKPAIMIEDAIEKISLANNIVAYGDKIDVFGKVKPGVAVYINGLPVAIDAEYGFKTVVPLDLQKNFVVVEARFEQEKKIWKYKVLRKAKVIIADVEKAKTDFAEKVEILATMGVIEVTPDADFAMDAGITRGELATWIVRASGIELTEVKQDLYADVSRDDFLAPYIQVAMALNLFSPFPDGTFRPGAVVSKEEGDVIFKRFGIKK